jgi:squalene synthase HpnC
MPCPIADVRTALERYGPEVCSTVSEREAVAWCTQLAYGHYENFSVLSSLVPKHLRPDFAAVYAFARWSDDLGDEIGDRERSLELLRWWREELRGAFAGAPRHPVMVALAPTIQRHNLPIDLFERLIGAFEADQTTTRYATWDDVILYCRGSADPVGRLVLMMLGEERSERLFTRSDAICTALQLTNHWQDVRRDLVERDRIYIPADMNPIADFEARFRATVAQGFSCDATFFDESRRLVRSLVERTWPLYEAGAPLLDEIRPESRALVWLFAAGGMRTLRQIELWNCETVLHRPTLLKGTKLLLVLKAWWIAKGGSTRRTRTIRRPEVAEAAS